MAEKSTGTRRFADAEEFRAKCDEYFDMCDTFGKLYGEGGLALYLGIKLATLQSYWDGIRCPDLQDEAQRAYLRIQDQIETDPRYHEKGGMTSLAIFLLKQKRFGGKMDRIEARQDMTINMKLGAGMEESDLK